MKKLASVLLSSALVASMAVVSVSAEVTELPEDWNPVAYEYIVVGNEGILGENAWQPTNEAFKMNYDEAANVWYLNLNGVGNEGETFDFYNSLQYKVIVYGYDAENPWAFSFNENGVAYGIDSNSQVDFGLTAETAEVVTITFDGYKTQSTIDNPYEPAPVGEHTYFAVGSDALFNPSWTPNCPDYQLTKGADGIYSVRIPVTEDQWDCDVSYKVAQDGTWDVSYNEQGVADGLNSDALLYIPEDTVAVVITFNPETLCAAAECIMAGEEPTEAPTEAPTDTPADEHTYFAVGNENLFDPAWTPDCPAYQLTKGEDGIYSVRIPVTEEQWDCDVAYKVAQDGTWDVSYNDQGLAEGLNSDATFYIPENTIEVIITFNPETLCTAAECVEAAPFDEHTYFAVGNENLFDPAWTPNCPAYQLTKGADGIYSVTIPVTEDQWDCDVAYKVAQDGTWDVSYNDQGLAEGLNSDATLYIAEGTVSVVITFNPETLCAGAECVMAGEDPTEPTTEEPTEAPTVAPTEAPTEAPTVAPTEAPTQAPTVAPTQKPTNATNPTQAPTKAPTQAPTQAPANSSTTGKVATGDSTSVTLLIGMVMLAGAGVLVARKKITE